MERAMHGIPFEIPLFLFATFAGAFVAGLSGFAFGLVAACICVTAWLALSAAIVVALMFRRDRPDNDAWAESDAWWGDLSHRLMGADARM